MRTNESDLAERQLDVARGTVATIWWGDFDRTPRGWKISTTIPVKGPGDVLIDHGTGPEKPIEVHGRTFTEALTKVLNARPALRGDPGRHYRDLCAAAGIQAF